MVVWFGRYHLSTNKQVMLQMCLSRKKNLAKCQKYDFLLRVNSVFTKFSNILQHDGFIKHGPLHVFCVCLYVLGDVTGADHPCPRLCGS